ncbi:MAG: ester cyclase [Caldilineaceae bacterium]|nr:ester cyclase [Caldilineaceae bacterium]
MLERNKDMIRRYAQTILTGQQYDCLDEFIEADFVDHRGSVPITGANELRTQMQRIHQGFSGLDFQVVHLVAEGDIVVVHFHVPGVHQGGFAGIVESGQAVTWKGVMIYRIGDNGKLCEGWGYWNDAEIVAALQL